MGTQAGEQRRGNRVISVPSDWPAVAEALDWDAAKRAVRMIGGGVLSVSELEDAVYIPGHTHCDCTTERHQIILLNLTFRFQQAAKLTPRLAKRRDVARSKMTAAEKRASNALLNSDINSDVRDLNIRIEREITPRCQALVRDIATHYRQRLWPVEAK